MGWGFGAVVVVGKAVGVEWEVWISVILGGWVLEEEGEEGGDGEGEAPFVGGGGMGRPRWCGLA